MTEEQEKKHKELDKKYSRKGMWMGLKNVSILILLTLVTVIINHLLFQPSNIYFAFTCGAINGIIVAKLIKADYKKTKKEIEEDVRKIFEE